MRITVTRQSADCLREEAWWFTYFDSYHALILDQYSDSTRPSRRHRTWTPRRCYDRLYSGQNQRWDHAGTPVFAADVPLPQDVLDEARDLFLGSLCVTTWEKRYDKKS